MRAEWRRVKDSVAGLPAWIADPIGVPHMVAGSNATQWYWGNGYDIAT